MEEGEALQYDPTAYDCMSSMALDWPCLSFDLLRDHLGAPRAAFPHTLFAAAGTQASQLKSNYLGVMKISNLAQGKHGQVRGPAGGRCSWWAVCGQQAGGRWRQATGGAGACEPGPELLTVRRSGQPALGTGGGGSGSGGAALQ